MNKLECGEANLDIKRIDTIMQTGIFTPERFNDPLFESALTELLIRLYDLLAKSNKYATRISFSDDVNLSRDVKDVTDLVSQVRRAICHPESSLHEIIPEQLNFSFNGIWGKGTFTVNETTVYSEFDDDAGLFFGTFRIYLGRHIFRAYAEVRKVLEPFISAELARERNP